MRRLCSTTLLLLAPLVAAGCSGGADGKGSDTGATGAVDTADTDDSGEPDDTETDCDLVFHRDADGDGYGNPDDYVGGCGPPEGYVGDANDCDDTNRSVYPDAPELCDDAPNACGSEGTWTADAERGTVSQLPPAGPGVSHTAAWAAGTEDAAVAVSVTEGEWSVCEGRFYVMPTVEGAAVVTGRGMDVTSLDARDAGRVFDVRADLALRDLTLQRGETAGDGGLVSITDANFLASDVRFEGGAALRGGAVAGTYTTPRTLTLEDAEMSAASANGAGGCVFVEGPVDLVVTRSFLGLCFASAGGGGAIHGSSAGDLTVTEGTFELDAATASGGAIEWETAAGDVAVAASTFGQPAAGGDGAALAITAANVRITDTTFNDGYADGDGGAVRLAWTDAALVETSSFSFNRSFRGGALAGFGGTGAPLSLVGTTMNGNEGYAGGAVYVSGAALSVEGGVYTDNIAVDGAGFMAESCPSLAFEAGTLVAGNVASFRGGGLYAVGTAVTITGDSALDDGFLANEATFGGGVCYEPDAGQALEAVNADFGVFEDDNIASGEGRDIYNLGVAASYGDGATFVCDSSGGCY